jgi:membrane protein implicated in regulation of membrane protease activity
MGSMAWFLLFAATVLGLYFWREFRVQQQDMRSPSAPHRAGERYIGQVLTLTEGLPRGDGRIKIDERQWVLRGPIMPPGARARVTGVDGRVLIVNPLPE